MAPQPPAATGGGRKGTVGPKRVAVTTPHSGLNNHNVFVAIAIELLAVGLFTLIAGISNEFGSVVVVFMVGLWLIYMLTTSQVLTKLGDAVAKIANANAA